MVDAYLRIQEALVADRIDTIAVDGRAIVAAAAQLGAVADPIRSAAAPFDAAHDISAARVAFGTLSDRMIAMVRSSKAGADPDLSVAYCPMAQKYWMQQGQAIQNPYYGRAMVDCGRVVKE
jgi:hypothetical protein